MPMPPWNRRPWNDGAALPYPVGERRIELVQQEKKGFLKNTQELIIYVIQNKGQASEAR
jgi:hypothetical protein